MKKKKKKKKGIFISSSLIVVSTFGILRREKGLASQFLLTTNVTGRVSFLPFLLSFY